MPQHDKALFKHLGDMNFSQAKPEVGGEVTEDNLYYYSQYDKLILVNNSYEKFYCGAEPTQLANLLVEFREGKMSLQETYTLLGIALGSEKVNNIY